MNVSAVGSPGVEERQSLDDVLIAIAVFLLLSATYVFWNDREIYKWMHTNTNQPVIARIDPASNDVRRKVSDDFSWFPVTSVEDVFNDDSVFTSESSVAYVTFYDNSKLKLDPNSLVVLRYDENGPSVIVKRGSASLQAAPHHQVRVEVDGQSHTVVGDSTFSNFQSVLHPFVSMPKHIMNAPLEQKIIASSVITPTALPQSEPMPVRAPTHEVFEPMKQEVSLPKEMAEPIKIVSLPPQKPRVVERKVAGAAPILTNDAPQIVADVPTQSLVPSSRVDYYPSAEPLKDPNAVKSKALEVSTDLSYLFGTNSVTFGEVKAQGWWNSFGLAANYSTSLFSTNTTIVNSNGTSSTMNTNLNRLNADLKYQIVPGEFDKTTVAGVSVGYQSIALPSSSAAMYGVGAFFGKQIEGDFNNLLNKVAFLNYPKWVELNFQYYFMPTTSDITLQTNFNLYAAGKLFVKPTFFVFTNIGYFQDGFTSASQGTQSSISAFYASLGIGFLF